MSLYAYILSPCNLGPTAIRMLRTLPNCFNHPLSGSASELRPKTRRPQERTIFACPPLSTVRTTPRSLRHGLGFVLPGSSVAEQVTVNHLVAGSIPARAARSEERL